MHAPLNYTYTNIYVSRVTLSPSHTDITFANNIHAIWFQYATIVILGV